jgi:hypothetical protein
MSSALRSISESATAEGVRRFLARHQSAMAVVADNRPLVSPRVRRGQELRERAHTLTNPTPHPIPVQIAHETHDQLSTLVVALSGKSKKASRGALLSSSASATASARKRQRLDEGEGEEDGAAAAGSSSAAAPPAEDEEPAGDAKKKSKKDKKEGKKEKKESS